MIQKCEARRNKPVNHISRQNPSGMSYQKCGRKAATKSQYGKPLCLICGKSFSYAIPPTNAAD